MAKPLDQYLDDLNMSLAFRLRAFYDRFCNEGNEAYLYLAAHAAFPIAMTPDLLYKIWLNFRTDREQKDLQIPYVAVSDLLLSTLYQASGRNTFEMPLGIREVLLNYLKDETRFGLERVDELAYFLEAYLQENPQQVPSEAFRKAQEYIVMARFKPEAAAERLLKTYHESIHTGDVQQLLSLAEAELNLQKTVKNGLNNSLVVATELVRGVQEFKRGNAEKGLNLLGNLKGRLSHVPNGGILVKLEQNVLDALPEDIAPLDNRPIMLAVFVDPDGTLPHLKSEKNEIVEIFSHFSLVRLINLFNPTKEHLEKVLLTHQERIKILHFAGKTNGQHAIVYDTAVHPYPLQNLIPANHRINFIFINGHISESAVQDLLIAKIPTIVSTDKDIQDYEAKIISTKFYQELAKGQSIRQVFNIACERLKSEMRIYPHPNDVVVDIDDFSHWGLHYNSDVSGVKEWTIYDLLKDQALEELGGGALISKTTSAVERMNGLVGLHGIKNTIEGLVADLEFHQERIKRGLIEASSIFQMFYVFTGNPGTGKTTVAHIFGKILADIGILKTGHLLEVVRADLVAAYVGQTSIKTKAKIDEALNGVLFINEVNSLVNNRDDFGMEAVATLLEAMSDPKYQRNMAIIISDYPEQMRQFLNATPGLSRRFTKFIDFNDYSSEELVTIFENYSLEQKFTLGPQVKEKAFLYLENLSRGIGFGNAREAIQLASIGIRNLNARLASKKPKSKQITEAELITILEEDIPTVHIDISKPTDSPVSVRETTFFDEILPRYQSYNPTLKKPNKEYCCIYPELYARFKSPVFKHGIDTSLPIDEKGRCIFHSEDIAWKRKNNFTEKLADLIQLLALLKEDQKTEHFLYKFIGFVFIGSERIIKRKNGKQERMTVLVFENLEGVGFDFQQSTFLDDCYFENISFGAYTNFDKSTFKGICSFNGSIFKQQASFCNCSFEKSFYCESTEFVSAALFMNSIFKGYFELNRSTFRYFADFSDAQFHSRTRFTSSTFDSQVIFKHTIFNNIVKFHDIEFKSIAEFWESAFLFTEHSDPMSSCVEFQNIDLQEQGLLYFKGEKPYADMFKDEVFITLKEGFKGKIKFENLNLNRIAPYSKSKLLALAKSQDQKVLIESGCLKYKYVTEPRTLKMNGNMQNIALEFVKTFTTFFVNHNGMNLGFEIIERNERELIYFYFSDQDNITQEQFEASLIDTEFDLWDFISNPETKLLAEKKQSNNERAPELESEEALLAKKFNQDYLDARDVLIDFTSIFFKLGARIEDDKLSHQDVEKLLHTIHFGSGDLPVNEKNVFNLIINQLNINKLININKENTTLLEGNNSIVIQDIDPH